MRDAGSNLSYRPQKIVFVYEPNHGAAHFGFHIAYLRDFEYRGLLTGSDSRYDPEYKPNDLAYPWFRRWLSAHTNDDKHDLLSTLPECRVLVMSILTREVIEQTALGVRDFLSAGGKILAVHTERNGSLDLFGMSKREAIKAAKRFFDEFKNAAREAGIYLIDFSYIQRDKIDGLYAQTVGRINESFGKEIMQERSTNRKVGLQLGKLLSILGVDIGIDGDLARRSATSTRVTYSLSDIQKCTLIYDALSKSDQLSYLNHALEIGVKPREFVRFRATMRYAGTKDEGQKVSHNNDHTFDVFVGNIANYIVKFTCVEEYFRISLNYLHRYLTGTPFEVAGIAAVVDLDENSKAITLSPFALWTTYQGSGQQDRL